MLLYVLLIVDSCCSAYLDPKHYTDGFVIVRLHCSIKMWPVATGRVVLLVCQLVICLSVCLLITTISLAEMAELIGCY